LMRVHAADGPKGSNLKRYVSFYFTNFPAQLSIFTFVRVSKCVVCWRMSM
jgi:hypothetical protein